MQSFDGALRPETGSTETELLCDKIAVVQEFRLQIFADLVLTSAMAFSEVVTLFCFPV